MSFFFNINQPPMADRNGVQKLKKVGWSLVESVPLLPGYGAGETHEEHIAVFVLV
jgi:hypothetical protein